MSLGTYIQSSEGDDFLYIVMTILFQLSTDDDSFCIIYSFNKIVIRNANYIFILLRDCDCGDTHVINDFENNTNCLAVLKRHLRD